ncbi:MAG TPA: DUF3536 domain-containing protein [Thermoplasmata archaeon]|nr:DUF3536 domain-containing protein [Thermoplasmata archaeon]
MRYVCVHGHFYQPPRENPWLEEVESQDTAQPYHDWNERITAECYRPNAWARIVDAEGYITAIQSNYERISFNFGPTLLHWLEGRAPDVYAAILAADKGSRDRFGGHGSAIAQAYNHQILPWANRRDKRTQVRWGLRDFERRFGRAPEGIWLPETAVDLETLGILAEEGLRFTILAPSQAARYRKKGDPEWIDAGAGTIPPTRAYEVTVPGERRISVFFYDGPISHDLAFGGVLDDGVAFAHRLVDSLEGAPADEPALAHIATDGETYGHHHRHGEMALAMALRTIEQEGKARLTNYAQFLSEHGPQFEVEVKERTAWSCAHGVERWHSDCGCNTGQHPGWNQRWRTPLRDALDHLRDTLDPLYEQAAREVLRDPWAARDDFAEVMGDRSTENVDRFLQRQATRELSAQETVRALELLELERHLQQMYTSCGWFFDDLGGIETVQVIQYAGRVLQLAERLFGAPFEPAFVADLALARGNVPPGEDGRSVYERGARAVRIDLTNVCAHFALSSLFENYEDPTRLFCYTLAKEDRRVLVAGAARLAVGRVRVTSAFTRETGEYTYGALHVGGYNLFGGVRPYRGPEAYQVTVDELAAAFDRADLPESVRLVDRHFGGGTYSLRYLFRDEQRRIVDLLLESIRQGLEAAFRQIFETTAPVLRYLADSSTPAPGPLRAATEYLCSAELQRAFDADPPNTSVAAGWLREVDRMQLRIDTSALGLAWTRAAERLASRLVEHPEDVAVLRQLRGLTELLNGTLDPNRSRVQERFYEIARGPYARERADGSGDEAARAWWQEFQALGQLLKVRTG